ncbi:MAG TPA: SDR family NAD(P)-dependent oxidoreductase [Allosphingosinicella sp.]|jgi:3-hydroxyacyl-CoA dehydrogenase/3a,7a,12a-trihydroxy-5b-cholest-24-enoyl-CoA hydratase
MASLEPLRFDGKVALITGAAGGLGLSHAREFAARGAKVILSDITPDVKSSASGIGDAAAFAVGSVTSRADCEAAVAVALEEFGRLDILVNNAGMLRDHTLEKQTDAEWQSVIDVHLTGTRNMTLAAWDALKASGAGRIINTSSASGLYGNFGQSNYCAAKMGIVGFTKACSQEGRRFGINVHCIAPIAHTPMTDDLWPDEMVKAATSPELVSPVVAYLSSEECQENSLILAAGGGYLARVAVVESAGVRLAAGEMLDAEWVAARFSSAAAMAQWAEPATVAYALDRAFGR